MGSQPHNWFALLLSVIAHVALGVAFGISGGEGGSASPGQAVQTRVFSVELGSPDRIVVSSVSDPGAIDKPVQESPLVLPAPPPTPKRASEEVAFFRGGRQPEPHYFLSKELTEKPHILRDVPSDLTVIVPGALAQPAILRLLINEQGEIDKVEIEESHLPEQAEHTVVDVFLKIKFDPGRIGDKAVKSQMRIQIILENTPDDIVPDP